MMQPFNFQAGVLIKGSLKKLQVWLMEGICHAILTCHALLLQKVSHRYSEFPSHLLHVHKFHKLN